MNDITTLVRKNILKLKPYSSARDEFSSDQGVFLDANENPFGDWNRYPDPYQKDLKKRLSEIKNIKVENLFLGNGSDEIIDLCFRVFCEPGIDKAMIFTPTYGMYKVSAGINDVEVVELSLNSDFQIDKQLFLNSVTLDNLKLIFICSPNNPTGNSIENIDFILEHFSGIVVVDEAYIDFSLKESIGQKLFRYPNLIVLQTLSKAWAMASLRIGIAMASPEIIGYFNKIKPPYNISNINQQKALALLEDIPGFEHRLLEIQKERSLLVDELKKLPFVNHIFPSDANFLLVKVSDANILYNYLISKGIIVRNRSHEIPETIRISMGSPLENRQLIAALKQLQS